MGLRIGTFSSFRRVLLGLRQNQLANIRAHEQLSSGRRILRPSDDPTGAARAIRLERQIADVDRYRRAITQGTTSVEAASSSLTSASGLMVEARELLIQSMNGTLGQNDRDALAEEFDLIRSQMLELGNDRLGELFFFGGASTERQPWVEINDQGVTRVEYRGDDGGQVIRAGESIEVQITLSGGDTFGRFDPAGTLFGGVSGVSGGSTADEGRGFGRLTFRHDSTNSGNLPSVGIGLVAGGSRDTILGDDTITIDATAGTIRLGTGPEISIPSPLEPDFVVTNELGAELHLDLTGYTGLDYTGNVRGNGSVSLDGTNFTALTFLETDLELSDEAFDRVVHLNTTGVKRAGEELVEFSGTTNVFDMLQQVASDLRNEDGIDSARLLDRLNSRLEDIDRHHQNILVGAGTLGGRSQRLQISDVRASELDVQLQSLLSDVADADLAEVALDLSRSDYLLQLAQAAGARVLQTSLLNYL